MHIDLNWRFDTRLLIAIFLRFHWLHHLHQILHQILFISLHRTYIKLFSTWSSSSHMRIDFVNQRDFIERLTWNSRKRIWRIAWRIVWKIAWRTAWRTEWKIFTNCMHVSLKNWIYDKRYMFWAHATVKYAREKRIFEIVVVETRSEEKKVMSRFLFDNIYTRDIIHLISHVLTSIIDSSTLTTRRFVFSLILEYKI